MGRVLPFCDGCLFAGWDGSHHWPCMCICHVQPVKTRPVAVRWADWKMRHE